VQVLKLIFGYFGGGVFPLHKPYGLRKGSFTFPPRHEGLDGIPPERAVYPLTFHDARSGWREGRGQPGPSGKNRKNGSDGVDPPPENFQKMTGLDTPFFLKMYLLI